MNVKLMEKNKKREKCFMQDLSFENIIEDILIVALLMCAASLASLSYAILTGDSAPANPALGWVIATFSISFFSASLILIFKEPLIHLKQKIKRPAKS